MNDDEKALALLEKAAYKAQDALEKTTHFKPFLMLLTDSGQIEVYDNEEEDASKSYVLLEEKLRKRIEKNDVDIIILAVDTMIPEKFVQDVKIGIRLYLEEKSQKNKKINARYIYIPYVLVQDKDEKLYVTLHQPIPVGCPAEFIV